MEYDRNGQEVHQSVSKRARGNSPARDRARSEGARHKSHHNDAPEEYVFDNTNEYITIRDSRIGELRRFKAEGPPEQIHKRPMTTASGRDLRPHLEAKKVRSAALDEEMVLPEQQSTDPRLRKIQESPFVRDIQDVPPPKNFTLPKFTKYDAKMDALTHLIHYRQLMDLYEYDEAMMCKAFPVSLQGVSLIWYNQLKPNSISSFFQLEQAFTARFVTNNTQPKTLDALVGLRRRHDENLRDYTERYYDVYNLIEDCDSKVAAASFKLALHETSALFEELMLRPLKDMSELMIIIEKYAQLEEAISERKISKYGGNSKSQPRESSGKKQVNSIKTSAGGRGGPKKEEWPRRVPNPQEYVAETTVFNQPIYRMLRSISREPWFTNKMGTADGRIADAWVKCSYHDEQGHYTTSCPSFKAHLERLVAQGHLDRYIDRTQTPKHPTPSRSKQPWR